MSNKTKSTKSAKPAFTWGIKSTEIDFVQAVQAAPLGTDCGCGSGVLPVDPKQKRTPGKTGSR